MSKKCEHEEEYCECQWKNRFNDGKHEAFKEVLDMIEEMNWSINRGSTYCRLVDKIKEKMVKE